MIKLLPILFCFLALETYAQNSNYEFSILLNRSTETISPQLSLDQIIASEKTSTAVKNAAITSAKNSLLPLVRITNVEQLTTQDNLKALAVRTLNKFALEFKKEISKIKIEKEFKFQLQVVPLVSKVLKSRINKGEVPLNPYYSTDKFSVMEPMPGYEDAYKTANQFMVTEVYNGYIKLVENMAGSENPFFISFIIDVNLKPNMNDSLIVTQSIIGLPTNKSMPFNKSNEQITFHTLKFPTYKKNDFGLVSAYPVAFVNLVQKLDQSPTLMNLQFGPLGTLSPEGRWVRPNGVDFKSFVPKLVGVAKKVIEVDFNIYNLNLNLATQQVSNLDLYLSAGIKGMGFKLGTINKTDVDSQFESEINKTIQDEIAKQKAGLSTKVDQNLAANTNISPDTIELLLSELFNVAKAGSK